jgi:uncharacterized repeat protein (TIGR03803 family)
VKTCIPKSLLPVLMTGMCLLLAGQLSAQTFSVLHAFSQAATNSQGVYTNSDGAFPEAGLISSGNILYGTTVYGTTGGWGTVFSVNKDGTGFTNLYNFTPLGSSDTNGDGAFPAERLLLSGNTLYGTTGVGGSSGAGTIFAINLNNLAFTNLHNFSYTEGNYASTLSFSTNDVLFGETYNGGSSGYGTLFRINPDGSGFTNLYNFSAPSGPLSTNSDGTHPRGGLFVSGNLLYGTTYDGGSSGAGTVFRFNTDFAVLKTLHDFTALSSPYPSTNSDGANPLAGVVISGNTLYGTAADGGVMGDGTVFAIGTGGVGFTFTNLHSFNGYLSDGTYPYGRLILFSNILYGTTWFGGDSSPGTVFAINTDGTGFTDVYSFTAETYNAASGFTTNSDGANLFDGLCFSPSEDTLYGTAQQGGSSGAGTVFSLTLPPPQLTIAQSGTNVVLSWPANVPGANYAGFVLQAATNLALPSWNNVDGPSPRTNAVSGPQMFYQLKQEVKEMPF